MILSDGDMITANPAYDMMPIYHVYPPFPCLSRGKEHLLRTPLGYITPQDYAQSISQPCIIPCPIPPTFPQASFHSPF